MIAARVIGLVALAAGGIAIFSRSSAAASFSFPGLDGSGGDDSTSDPSAIDDFLSTIEGTYTSVIDDFDPSMVTVTPEQGSGDDEDDGSGNLDGGSGDDSGSSTTPGQGGDQDTVARTLYGEAANQGVIGMTAVACVIRNRANSGGQWPSTYTGVCLQPNQFDCWNGGQLTATISNLDDSNAVFVEALTIAQGVISGATADITGGAVNYVRTDWFSHKQRNGKTVIQNWTAQGLVQTVTIGAHTFFRQG